MLGPEKSLAHGELWLGRGEGVALPQLNRPQQAQVEGGEEHVVRHHDPGC